MFIQQLQIHNFRCFKFLHLEFNQRIILLQGPNGSGKTSLLEALYFAAYRRSFRTAISSELINYDVLNAFNIQLTGISSPQDAIWNITAGCSIQEKFFKVNNQPVRSFKSLIDIYRIISLTEDDVMIIKGAPALRRAFIDQSIVLESPEFIKILWHYKKILQSRNTLLYNNSIDSLLYETWTFQLWTYACMIEKKRIETLCFLEKFLKKFCLEFLQTSCSLSYHNTLLASCYENFDDFMKDNLLLYTKERAAHRSLFGPHLHNIEIILSDTHPAKSFSSRGMQKFLIFLLKIAQVYLLNQNIIFLIDDFFVDLDQKRIEYLSSLLADLDIQLFFTSPLTSSFGLESAFNKFQVINFS
jgi:DNA replication and repair protein RecF